MSFTEMIGGIGESASSFVSQKPITAAVIGSAVGGAAVFGTVKAVKARKKTKKKSTTTKRKTKKKAAKKERKLKFGSPAWRKKYIKKGKKKRKGPKYARTAGKRKDTSTRRIRMTKNGQPYVILKSGKARFIKKSSARRSRKLKGGRY